MKRKIVTMNKVKKDYAGTEIWTSNKQFVAKERTPVYFQRTSINDYRQLGNMLVNKTSPRTGYITKLALNK